MNSSEGLVAEPKPTPSAQEESASWIVSVTASHPAYLKQFEADLPGERSYGVNRISVRRLPQPDSSSISTEQTFEEWWLYAGLEYSGEEYEAARAAWQASLESTKALHRSIIDKINLTQIAGSGMSESDLLEEIKGRLEE